MKIKEPIFIIVHDSKEIVKYEYLINAENDLEAYDLDNYSAFDTNLKKLELYKKDQYNRVGFKILDCMVDEKKIRSYLLNQIKVVDNTLTTYELLGNLPSYENLASKQSSLIPKIFTALFIICLGIFIVFSFV